jgi:hypothetical protein
MRDRKENETNKLQNNRKENTSLLWLTNKTPQPPPVL